MTTEQGVTALYCLEVVFGDAGSRFHRLCQGDEGRQGLDGSSFLCRLSHPDYGSGKHMSAKAVRSIITRGSFKGNPDFRGDNF